MIRVLIVDDHEVVRRGLRLVLEQAGDIEVCGECGEGRSALAAIRAEQPDVVLLDLVMPGVDGLAVLDALDGENRPAVIVLTSVLAEDKALEAVRAGATSYLQKTTAVNRVVDAVRATVRGGSVLEPGVAALLVQRVQAEEADGPLQRLSVREREVLALLSRGRSNREIARSLVVGEQTVKSHVSSILAKLALQDRTQAAIFGLQRGLVPLDEALEDPLA
jgi:NarL family two-component system response regulator LiaR